MHLGNSQRTYHPQAFPQLGELPAIAGLLLYPDKREKMVTTTEVAFGPKPYSRTEPKKILHCSLTMEGEQSFITTNQMAYQPADGTPLMMRRKSPVRQGSPLAHYQTNYQQNFVLPQIITNRRLYVLPGPDNLAINPALRQEAANQKHTNTAPEYKFREDKIVKSNKLLLG
ncbi:uncharacterized protein si:dkeyp-69c1.9 [Trichomycterus rosablanca]|uniref:uncharacterized protein si:dkeyp-69c1.9 n=1 Tax=Trichomycterus rosablanca TaxID=2290929 RepID=UPI002F358417